MSTEERKVSRRMKGFEPTGGLLRKQIQKASEDRGFAIAQLLTQWDEIAGPDIAPVSRPVKVNYAQGGFGATLTLLVKGAFAPMVEASLPILRAKVNACYGYNAISRIRLTQTAAELSALPKTRPEPPRPRPETKVMTKDVGDAQLREALEALGNSVLSRAERKGN